MFQIPFFQYLLYTIVALHLVLFLGHIVIKFLKLNSSSVMFNFFQKLFFGIVGLVTMFSLYKSSFNSINLLTLAFLLGIFFAHREKNEKALVKKLYVLPYLITIVFVSISFGVFYYFFIYKTNAAIYGDNHFYSMIAYQLRETGIESTSVDWTKQGFTISYHYTEQWFAALFAKLFSIHSLYAYYFIYAPLFLLMTFFGALSLYETLIHNKIKGVKYWSVGILSGFLFLFIQIIDNPFDSTVLLNNFFYIGYPLFNIKYLIIYACFILCFIHAVKKKYTVAFYCLLLLVPLYSTVIPSVMTGLFSLLIYLYFTKKINVKVLFLYLSIIFLCLFAYIIFYYLQTKLPSQGWNTDMWEQFYDSVHKISKILLMLVIGLSIFLVLYFYSFNKLKNNSILTEYYKRHQLVHAAFVFVCSGCLIVFIIFPVVNTLTHDSFQLLSNFIIPIYTIVFFCVVLLIIKNKNTVKSLVLLTLFLCYFLLLAHRTPPNALNMNQKHSTTEIKSDPDYFLTIQNIIREDPNPRFAYYRPYTSEGAFLLKSFLCMPDNRILHFHENYMPLSLNPHEIPKGVDYRFGNPLEHPFYQFCLKKSNYSTLEEMTLAFLKKHEIRYIILENNYHLPEFLSAFIEQSAVNKVNHNVFLKLSLDKINNL